jgi:hypothetical protein
MAPEFGEELHQLPILPIDLLKKHHCAVPTDTRFRANARLLQSLWRQDKELPMGSYVRPDGEKFKLGSRLTDAAGRAGGNFLTAEIAHVARRETAYREIGAMIDESRLATNLLSSMPLAFNLFAPMRGDTRYATRVLQAAVPGFDGEVTQILFEHAPGRGYPVFTGDHSAFDVLIRYRSPVGKRGILAIEVKYSEGMTEAAPQLHSRYEDIAETSDLFVEPASPALRRNPLQQIFREHCLAQSMLDAKIYDEASFIVIYPRLNWQVDMAVAAYAQELSGNGRVRFLPITLEHTISAIAAADASAYAQALHRRYTDFWLVDGEMELLTPRLRSGRKPRTTPLALPAPGKNGATGKVVEGDGAPSPRRPRARKSRGH